MEKNFKLEQIGKRTPYSMPEGFMKEMEDNVMRSVAAGTLQTRHKPLKQVIFRSAVAAAAVAALFTVSISTMQPKRYIANYTEVDQAFDNLSYDDQQYMIDTYSNDVFMAEEEQAGM